MPASRGTVASKSKYSVHPGFAREASSEENLLANTGNSISQWVEFLKKSGQTGKKERVAWLKSEHNLGTNYATWIAERADGGGGTLAENYDPDALVESMFSGKKAPLQPLYDELLIIGMALGADVKACPCKTIVPLYRKHVFAQIKPATNNRIDLGLALKTTKAKGRLIDTGGLAKGDRITHRIEVVSVDDIDAELKGWLKQAYDMDE